MSAATPLQHALQLAEEHNLPVFPCRAADQIISGKTYKAKSPLTPAGFKDASKSIEQIVTWWDEHPDALIGVPTGAASGLFVIDVDPRGADWYSQNSQRLEAGRIHKTLRGHHLVYKSCGLGCSTSTLSDGVDTRGDGGYIIWWPAIGLATVGEIDDADTLPQWVGDALRTNKGKAGDDDDIGDRSRDLMRRVARDVRAGLDDATILKKYRDHPHARDQRDPDRAVQRCIDKARAEPGLQSANNGPLGVDDFYGYMPMHQYIFVPSRELWPAASVNARCSAPTHPDGSAATRKVPRKGKDGAVVFEDVALTPAEFVDQYRPVDQLTWAPGEPLIIRDRLVSNGGWVERAGVACFNQYRPPTDLDGDADKAGPWLDHVAAVYPDDAQHIISWLAHRVQRPHEKINHALVLGGVPGIGKDTILEPVKVAVGAWNFEEVQPPQLLGRFNGFIKSVILRVSEARDLGDVDRYAFYDHLKVLLAAPPDVLRCDEKHLREHSVLNVVAVVITTNYKTDGIYLPPDDRRHYVAWSDRLMEEFDSSYWPRLYGWYDAGGVGHVRAYLHNLDLSGFDAKAPPKKTAAFWAIADANRAPEDAEVADALDAAGRPRAITLQTVRELASTSFQEWLDDRRNRRQIPHRFEAAGYVPVRNETTKDGLFVVVGRRQPVYAQAAICLRDRITAANDLVRRSRP